MASTPPLCSLAPLFLPRHQEETLGRDFLWWRTGPVCWGVETPVQRAPLGPVGGQAACGEQSRLCQRPSPGQAPLGARALGERGADGSALPRPWRRRAC